MKSSRGLWATGLGFLFLLALTTGAVQSANCDQTSIKGLTPLNDLGPDYYQDYQGGLYPNGSNWRPDAHEAAGLDLASQVTPLDADGNPDPVNGKIVLLSIGMSNTTQEFSAFQQIANRDPDRNPQLIIVDGAQGGQSADIIVNPKAPFWAVVNQRLQMARVTPNQVQAVWLKEADPGPRKDWAAYALRLQNELTGIVQILKSRFPNLLLTYLSSRTYGGYASSPLNPDRPDAPYAFASGFSVKWLIEDQITGNPELNYDPKQGKVKAPWLSWGPYLWANGLMPRSDGLTWSCEDFMESDGTHPSALGRQKVARLLLDFFKTDSTTASWFLRP